MANLRAQLPIVEDVQLTWGLSNSNLIGLGLKRAEMAKKTRFLPIFGHFAKVSNPYWPFFYFTNIGVMGVVGKLMDSAIFPEKMSSRSALLAGFITR